MKNSTSRKLGSSLTRIFALALVFLLAVGVISIGITDPGSVDAASSGSNTFVYVGTSGKSAGDLWWYVTWAKSSSTTATEGQLSTFGITKSVSTINGYSAVTLSGDPSNVSDIWANFGFDGQISYTQIPLDGTTYFISDTGISTTAPADFTTTTTTAAANIGSNTFVYVGTSGKSAGDLWWYVSWAKSKSYTTATEGQLSTFKMTKTVGTYGDYTAVTISGDKNDLSDIWANFGFDGKIANTSIPLNGTVYYITDTGISTTAPTTTTTTAPEGTTTTTTTTTVANIEYSLTVNLYNNGGAMGAWPMVVENGTETAWGSTKTASLNGYDGEWSSAALTWSTTEVYNSIGFQVSTTSDPWAGSKYSTSFINNSAVVWIIPGDSTVYTSLDDAKAAIDSGVEATEYVLNVNFYSASGALGAWTTLVENGTETAWGDSLTTTFAGYDGEWSSASISWTSKDLYNRFGFQVSETSDPWAGTKYSVDFTGNSAAVWIIPGDAEAYTSLEAAENALAGDAATTTTIVVHYQTSSPMDGWKVGSWFGQEVDGDWGEKTTSFTYKDGWGYVAIIQYDIKVPQVGYMIYRDVVYDGITTTWFTSDTTTAGSVTTTNGYAEIWLVANESSTTQRPDDAVTFSPDNAERCYVPGYVYWTTGEGTDATLFVHFYKADGDYKNWALGLWGQRNSGKWDEGKAEFTETDEYGGVVAEIDLKAWPVNIITMAVHYNNWASRDGVEERDVPISLIKDGEERHVYIYEGDPEVYYEPQEDIMAAS